MHKSLSSSIAATALVAGGLWSAAPAAAPAAPAGARGSTPSATMTIDVATGHRAISPLIYGINDDKDVDSSFAADLSETHAGLVRLGGNRWTAYNWVNNASNAGSDYQYENDDYLTPSTAPGAAVLPTVQAAEAAGAAAVVTVPINGYVSADENPPGPVQNSGPNYLQTRFKVEVPTDPGPLTTTPDPNATQVYENQFVYWLKHAAPKARVLFELDNEPDLWDSTHAEVHPAQTTYAEVLQKDLEYARAIKAVWPSAEVSGPVSYGWEGYETLQNAPDSSKDGNFLDWYLRNVAAAGKAAGHALVDDLDLHWYPEATDAAGTRVTGTDVSAAEVVAREQAPRSLWDPTYVEDSWITKDSTGGKAIELIPRVEGQIAADDPGAKLALTEWNYGGGQSISGAIASADVLGIFGRYGVHAAAWWGLNPVESYSLAAFAAFRNYDGHGSGFGDTEVTASDSNRAQSSVYASVDAADPHRLVIVAINKNSTPTTAHIDVTGGFTTTSAAVWRLTAGGGPRLVAAPALAANGPDSFTYQMPAQSVSVVVPAWTGTTPTVAVAATSDGKGWFAAEAAGRVVVHGDARSYGDMSGRPLNAPLIGVAVDPATGGYWLLGEDGGIFAFHAPFYGSTGGMHLAAPAVGIAAVPGGGGYRVVAADGGVFDFGGARYAGSLGGRALSSPVVGMAAGSGSTGYVVAQADGTVTAFG